MAKKKPIILNGAHHEPIASGDTLDVTFYGLNKVRFVDGENGDDTNDGKSLNAPWKTLSYAAANTPTGCTLNVMPSTYGTPFTWTVPNVDIIGLANRSGIVNITGAVAVNHTQTNASVGLKNISFANGLTVSAAGRTYTTECQVSSLIKSGGAYYRDLNSDIAVINVTGLGLTVFQGGDYGNVTVNNVAAFVNFSTPLSINVTSPISVVNGICHIAETVVTGPSAGANVLTTAAGTTVILRNVTFADSVQQPTAVTIAGSWSMDNVNYNPLTSAITGANAGLPAWFDIVAPVIGTLGTQGHTDMPAGFVGEVLSTNGTFTGTIISGVDVTLATLNLTPGRWDVHAWAEIKAAAGDTIETMVLGFDPASMVPNRRAIDNNRQGKVSYVLPLNRYNTTTALAINLNLTAVFSIGASAEYYIAARRVA